MEAEVEGVLVPDGSQRWHPIKGNQAEARQDATVVGERDTSTGNVP